MATARPAIERWFAAWSLASEQLLKLPDAPPPQILLFDSPCAYTTSGISAGTAPSVDGPALRGVPMAWHVLPHGDSLLLPNGSSAPVALMSFASSTPQDGPFFVMALPSYWAEAGHSDPSDFTAVFLHEFSHTRQIEGMGPALGPIDASWPFPEELDDDAVQTHFKDDPEYVTAYLAERDLLYRAADAATVDEARALAAEALKMMRTRHARWFVGDKAVFTKVDDIFLALEGVGQWTAYAWLAQPDGGSLDRPAAIAKMLGTRRWWSQDEGLALLLAVDRLLPGWPALEFSVPSLGATELLARAVKG
ncbi:MAG: hypothetical protein ABI639_03800 [Thermoanaerobaculia bacterium]